MKRERDRVTLYFSPIEHPAATLWSELELRTLKRVYRNIIGIIDHFHTPTC